MDKPFLLEYTSVFEGVRHSFHAWFITESEMDAFICRQPKDAEILLAIEIKSCRVIRI